MSLENNIERIANALEMLVAQGASQTQPASPAPAPDKKPDPVQEVPEQPAPPPAPAATAPVPPAPAAAPAAPPAAPPAAAPASDITTREQLNAALVTEFKRLGGREQIDKAITDMGAQGIDTLDESRWGELIEKVKAIPA